MKIETAIIGCCRHMTEGECALISRLLSLLILIALNAYGSVNAQIGSDPTHLTVISGASIGYDAEKKQSFIDFPYVLNRFEFQFLEDSSGVLVGGAGVTVTLFDTLGMPVDSSSLNFAFRAQDSSEAQRSDMRLCGKVMMDAARGRYTARMEVIDMVSKKTGERFYRAIEVPAWTPQTFGVGHAMTAWKISEPTEEELKDQDISSNYRNGFSVLANPLGVFGQHDTSLFLYAEVYGLGVDSSEFLVRAVLVDSTGHRRELVSSRQKKPGSTAIIATSISMADWPSGPHTLWITAFDPGRGLSASTNLSVNRIHFAPPTIASMSAAGFQGDPYDTMSLDDKEHMTHFFIPPPQRTVLENMSDSAKQRFLAQFWRERDNVPGTTTNETRREIAARYAYVNAHYSTTAKHADGWRTDRGRIYLTMGPPEELDREAFPEIEWPYEVWYYYSRKKSPLFVFQDMRNDGEFKLAHSNMDGELYNAVWAQRLSRQEGNRPDNSGR